MNWIKVTEQLPDLDRDVLVFERGAMVLAYLNDYSEWCPHYLDDCSIGENPSHWMPLPELPPDEEWMTLCAVCKNHFIPFEEEDKCALCIQLEPKGIMHVLD